MAAPKKTPKPQPAPMPPMDKRSREFGHPKKMPC